MQTKMTNEFNIWNQIAKIRFNQISSGKDITFLKIFEPFYVDIVKKNQSKKILEISSGTGHMSLCLSKFVNQVYALEPAPGMFTLSKNLLHGKSNICLFNETIEEFQVQHKFDLILSHLCLQTIKEPNLFLKKASKYLINNRSKLIFSIPHPCFWNKYKKWFNDDKYIEEFYIEGKLSISLCKSDIMQVPYFHRPIQKYVKYIDQSSLKILEIVEHFPDKKIQNLYPEPWIFPRYMTFILSLQ